jgi:serine/threonine-protein kinase HipA
MKRCLYCYEKIEDANEDEYHSKCSKKFWKSERPPELSLNDETLKDWMQQTVRRGISLTGVQPKLSAGLEERRLTYTGLPGFIVKLPHSDYIEMVENEDVTLKIAADLGIKVCEHSLLRTQEGVLVYIARRFDRSGKKKIHVEDFYQLKTEWNFKHKYLRAEDKKYKSSYEEIGGLIKRYSSFREFDLLLFFETVLFCYLTGNNDMHLKNFSMLHISGGARFAPAYDLLNVRILNPKDKEALALTLNGKKANLKRSDFDAFAKNLGIGAFYYERLYPKYLNAGPKVKEWLNKSFLSEKNQSAYFSLWQENIESFLR